MNLHDILAGALLNLSSGAATADEVFGDLVAPLGDPSMRVALRAELEIRHRMLPCSNGGGVAFPDTISFTIPTRLVSFVRTLRPIDFGAADGVPVRLFFGLFGPREFVSKSTAYVSRALRTPAVRDELLIAPNASAFCGVLTREDDRIRALHGAPKSR